MTHALLRNQPDVGRKFVHHLLADVAKGIAAEFWDQMCSGAKTRGRIHPDTQRRANEFRKTWPDQTAYAELQWPKFVDSARVSLAMLLGKPGFSEVAKAEIKEALDLDALANPRKLSPEAAAAQELAKLTTPKR
jgi:hypothetical protein